MIVVLAGGVGAARFLQGLVQVVPQERLTVIGNTGDDRDFYGLHVSPDLDIVMYTLAGVVDETHGWGIRGDTYYTMQQLTSYGNEDWFMLGDRDLATHIHRTNLLHQGKTLSEVTEDLRRRFGLGMRILPMSDQPVQTHIRTPAGLLHFQEYMVKRRCADEVQDVRWALLKKSLQRRRAGVRKLFNNDAATFGFAQRGQDGADLRLEMWNRGICR